MKKNYGMVVMKMKNVLIIDDSKLIVETVTYKIASNIDANIFKAYSYKEAGVIISQNEIDVAIVDVHLPDADSGQAIDLTLRYGIPTIVLTGTMNEKIEKIISRKPIYEFIHKNNQNSLEFLVYSVKTILFNSTKKALIVDDSEIQRKIYKAFLDKMFIKYIEAKDGLEALNIIESSGDDISIVIVDYVMPNMNGAELCLKIREKYTKDKISIVAASANDDVALQNKFFQYGANDFISKPCNYELFKIRVQNSIETLELFDEIKNSANLDNITKSYNSQFFYDISKNVIDRSLRSSNKLGVILMNIDNFGKINRAYGYDIGNVVLKEVYNVLKDTLRESDIITRFESDEFAIYIENADEDDLDILFNKVRRAFEFSPIQAKEHIIQLTVSFGIFHGLGDSVDDMLGIAKNSLKIAKETEGKNSLAINEIVREKI
jgi:diguanylate cyclase (GGDEF)-like protein